MCVGPPRQLIDQADSCSQILNKDFYHVSAGMYGRMRACISSGLILRTASLDIKSKAPNGVTFNVKGKASHEGKNAGSVSFAATLSI